MANYSRCACCGAAIEEGQRWVREKVFEPRSLASIRRTSATMPSSSPETN